jgi:hypothetical protein
LRSAFDTGCGELGLPDVPLVPPLRWPFAWPLLEELLGFACEDGEDDDPLPWSLVASAVDVPAAAVIVSVAMLATNTRRTSLALERVGGGTATGSC